jgi:uncharacterized damage-inducible protein DinB
MHSLEIAHDLHAWLRWCTDRSVAAARTLTPDELHRPFDMGLGSVFGTLLHLYGAESLWIRVLDGTLEANAAMPTREQMPTLDSFCSDWPRVRAQWDRYLAAADDAELARVVVRVREGREFRQRAIDAIVQVPTHALYHNAQLSSMFRQMGKQLPDSSYILWARERLGQPAAV